MPNGAFGDIDGRLGLRTHGDLLHLLLLWLLCLCLRFATSAAWRALGSDLAASASPCTSAAGDAAGNAAGAAAGLVLNFMLTPEDFIVSARLFLGCTLTLAAS